MSTIVKGAKLEGTTTYIGQVRKDLPKLLREKVGQGTKIGLCSYKRYTMWM
jgi:hypothetical protein